MRASSIRPKSYGRHCRTQPPLHRSCSPPRHSSRRFPRRRRTLRLLRAAWAGCTEAVVKYAILDWMKKRGSTTDDPRATHVETAKRTGRVMAGKYLLLYTYLENRYANMVVLTFAEIEDLLGFALPDQARLRHEWWTDAEQTVAGPNYSDSWILASRTATPNLLAQTVAFERAV